MKLKRAWTISSVLAWALLFASLSGCSRQNYSFRCVDQVSGEALQGVSATSGSSGHYLGIRLFPYSGGKLVNHPTSGDDGILTASDVPRISGVYTTFSFDKEGYDRSQTGDDNGFKPPVVTIIPRGMDNSVATHLTMPQPKEGDIIIIPLRKSGSRPAGAMAIPGRKASDRVNEAVP